MSQDFYRYSVGWSGKLLPFLTTCFLLTLCLLVTGATIRSLIFLPPDTELADIIALILAPGILVAFISPFIITLPNLEPDIQISDEGLSVQCFWFWWVFISWGDIEEVSVPLFGLSRSRVIVSSKLPFVYHLIGGPYGSFFKRGFLLSSKLEGYNLLTSMIKRELRRLEV
jgi:hypothetical protein